MERAFERLAQTSLAYLPPLLAGLVILFTAWVLASLVRWVLNRIFKGTNVDRFLHQTGLSTIIDRSGRLRASKLVSGGAYWLIIGIGALTGLSAFDTQLTSTIIQSVVFLMPKLVTAGAILLVGGWLAQYVARSVLIWACNEQMPLPRLWASAVRFAIVFVSVVVAADHLNFARSVFLAAFVLLVGGAVLALSIAIGLNARDLVARHLRGASAEEPAREAGDRSLWQHL